MNIQEFAQLIIERMQDLLGEDYEIEYREALKNNSLTLHGISFRREDRNIAPTIYIENYFEKYQMGVSLEHFLPELASIVRESEKKTDVDMEYFSRFDLVKDRVCCRVICTERNKELLQGVPNLPFLDLSIVFYYAMPEEELSGGTVLISEKMMQMWGVTVSELMKVSLSNMKELLPHHCMPIADLIMEILKQKGMEAEYPFPFDSPILVLTNDKKCYGASVILYPGVLESVSKECEAGLYIIPSSIHEVLILPETDHPDEEALRGMIRDINAGELRPEEVLSDNLYYFDPETRRIRICS